MKTYLRWSILNGYLVEAAREKGSNVLVSVRICPLADVIDWSPAFPWTRPLLVDEPHWFEA